MRVLIASGFAALLAGCSVDAPAGGQEAVLDHDGLPTIVTLRTREGTVTVHSSAVGPVFTVARGDGTVEAEALSLVELQDRFPSFYRMFRSSVAETGLLYAGWYDDARENGPVELIADR